MWREMRERKIPMNIVAYNVFIDAQARVGAMEEVEILVTSMQPNRCTPDVIPFSTSTIVKGYCAHKEVNKAIVFFPGLQFYASRCSLLGALASNSGCPKYGAQ